MCEKKYMNKQVCMRCQKQAGFPTMLHLTGNDQVNYFMPCKIELKKDAEAFVNVNVTCPLDKKIAFCGLFTTIPVTMIPVNCPFRERHLDEALSEEEIVSTVERQMLNDKRE